MLSVCEMFKLSPPLSKRNCLTFVTGIRKWELLGISYLLRSSLELETLALKVVTPSIIHVCEDFQDKHQFRRKGYMESRKALFRSLSHELKTIKPHSVIGCRNNLDQSSYVDDENGLPKQFQKEMELMKFLLKNAHVLQEIIIYVNQKENFEDPKRRELLFNLFETLFKCPRASLRANVLFQ